VAESPDPRDPLDARIDSPGREGLTGTAPASVYQPITDREQVTIAPDGRPAREQPVWRRDFPIDWPQDHYVARRDFMKFMVLTSLAFTVGQFWIAVRNWWRGRRGALPARRIVSLDEIPVGGVFVFAYPEPHDSALMMRLREDEVVAFSQKCTHLSCAVVPRPETHMLVCPCHEGYFDARSGGVISGPPRRPLPRVLLEVRGRDVYATGIELRTT
jgi:nitrite reductase/ring-hydroxylating ferredoxin subunit